MPRASIVVPAFNTLKTLPETVASLLAQTYDDFEVIVVDDGSADGTAQWVLSQSDPRLRLVRQLNRGLAGARNGGIAASKGRYIGFCDGDDLWAPEKLAAHVAHLDANPEVGVSYSASALVDEAGAPLGLTQQPKTLGVSARDIFLRNPVGNGSAPVIRRACLDDIAFSRVDGWTMWFDESFRQSEDIECWMRIALTTDWRFEGLEAPLTQYRIVASGLSANLPRQLATWERVAARVADLAPGFAERHTPAARAYQLRYLARRAASQEDGAAALKLTRQALTSSLHPLFYEPGKTLSTLAASLLLCCGGGPVLRRALKGRAA